MGYNLSLVAGAKEESVEEAGLPLEDNRGGGRFF